MGRPSISDPLEPQSPRGCCSSCLPSIPTRHNRFERFRTLFAPPDVYQGSDQRPHHVLQKATAFDLEPIEPLIPFDNGTSINASYRVLRHAIRCPERAEVMLAQENATDTFHRRPVQDMRNMPCVPLEKNGPCLPIQDLIGILLTLGLLARMKPRPHFFYRAHSDVSRQRGVQSTLKYLHGNGMGGVKVGHLPSSMHACIGPSGAMDSMGCSQDPGKPGLNLTLQGGHIRLVLPALVSPTVILEGQLQDTLRSQT